MKNILSFDVEDWNQLAYRRVTGRLLESCTDLYRQLDFVLQVLADHATKATFFVLGIVAEKHADLIRTIAKEGHEVASHGYAHLLVHQLSKAEFRHDTEKSRFLLEDIIGSPVEGYRAAEFSIRADSLWGLTTLAELGFKYDSSIFPVYHRRYGIPGFAPGVSHYHTAAGARIVEIPLTSLPFCSVRVPVAGGGYFRLTPFPILRFALQKRLRSQQPLVTYFHPAEFDERRLSVFNSGKITGWKGYLRGVFFNLHQNLGRRGMRHKLPKLMEHFRFTTCRNFLEEADPGDSTELLPIAS